MQNQTAIFVTSAAAPSQFLRRPIPHFVFAGKSNVGKSSILNKLLNRKNLAKTSQTPGKTRLINYFLIDEKFYFVDIPGYGYAKVSKSEQSRWGKLIVAYFKKTPYIALIFQLIDIRHNPTENDVQMISWLRHHQLPFRILLTKADKLSNNKIRNQRVRIARHLGLSLEDLIVTSAVTATGVREVRRMIGERYEAAKNLHFNDRDKDAT